jgi:peptidoglycan hydrolase-like protein with peptidoglycan-binding domain
MMKLVYRYLQILSFTILIIPTFGLANEWDGRYSTNFDFRMGSASVCPRSLPINIDIEVSNGSVTGVILNNGGGNNHRFCKLYHNGTISGSVDSDGSVRLQVQQKDSHSRQYSSHSINGQIDRKLTLISRSAKFHPTKSFSLTRNSNTASRKSAKATNIAKKATITDYIGGIFNAYSIQKRKDIQSELKKGGFYTSSIDGLYGKGTRRAIAKFASENGYSVTSERGVTTALAKVLEGTANKEQKKQIVIATNINVTKAEPKVDNRSSTATKTPISTTLNNSFQKWENAQTVEEAQRYVDQVQATIVMYMAIREVVDEQPPTMKERVLGVVDNEISRLQKQKTRLQDRLTQRFTTPIKPSNANLQVSAFRASDTFPKVPFYIPGTNEIGETLVTPRVSDEGYLNYKFDFIDPVATYDKVRDTVLIPHNNIDELITGMGKIDEWTQVAQENGVNRRISKAAACIPTGACEVKKAGVSSTELLFQVYEDGSTSGRMQINKGQFNVGYNMSVESTILLQAYLIYMRDLGSKEFNVGVMSDEEVLELFD